jgi:hypothetical protein
MLLQIEPEMPIGSAGSYLGGHVLFQTKVTNRRNHFLLNSAACDLRNAHSRGNLDRMMAELLIPDSRGTRLI